MAYRFGSATEGDIVAIGTSGRIVEYPCGTSASGCQSWKILPGRYDFAADFLSMTLSVHNAWTLGVEYVGDKDAGPVYYTIEGLRVEQPTEGLYIVVRDGKASKQLIKR